MQFSDFFFKFIEVGAAIFLVSFPSLIQIFIFSKAQLHLSNGEYFLLRLMHTIQYSADRKMEGGIWYIQSGKHWIIISHDAINSINVVKVFIFKLKTILNYVVIQRPGIVHWSYFHFINLLCAFVHFNRFINIFSNALYHIKW